MTGTGADSHRCFPCEMPHGTADLTASINTVTSSTPHCTSFFKGQQMSFPGCSCITWPAVQAVQHRYAAGQLPRNLVIYRNGTECLRYAHGTKTVEITAPEQALGRIEVFYPQILWINLWMKRWKTHQDTIFAAVLLDCSIFALMFFIFKIIHISE